VRKSMLLSSIIIFGLALLILLFLIIYFGIIGLYKFSWLFQGLMYMIIGLSQGIIGWTQLKQMRNKGNYISWHKQPQIMLGGVFIFLGIGSEMLFINSEYVEQQGPSSPLGIFLLILMIAAFLAAIVFLVFGINSITFWRRKMLASPKV
jgi:hypothetical protein